MGGDVSEELARQAELEAPPPEPAEETAKPVTLEDVNTAVRKLIADPGFINPLIQGRVAKELPNIVKRIQGVVSPHLSAVDTVLEDLKAAGLEVTADVADKVRSRRLVRSFTEPEEEAEPEVSEELEQTEDLTSDPRVAATAIMGKEIFDQYGTEVGEGDPEMKMINFNTDKPMVFLAGLEKATAAKAKRLAGVSGIEQETEQETEEDRTSAIRKARRPARGVTRSAPFEGKSAMDLFSIGYAASPKRR